MINKYEHCIEHFKPKLFLCILGFAINFVILGILVNILANKCIKPYKVQYTSVRILPRFLVAGLDKGKVAEFTHSPRKLRRSFLRRGVAAPLEQKILGF